MNSRIWRLLLIIPAIWICRPAIQHTWNHYRLIRHGAIAVAQVQRVLEIGSFKKRLIASYQFTTSDGARFEGSDYLNRATFEKIPPTHSIQIQYLPANPRVSEVIKINAPSDLSVVCIFALFLAASFFMYRFLYKSDR